MLAELKTLLAGDKIDAVICVAGGWAGGNAASKDFVKSADAMWRQSVWSSVLAATIAAHHLKPGGLVSLPGAKPALQGTPGKNDYSAHADIDRQVEVNFKVKKIKWRTRKKLLR